jgi:hypothetical protein
MNKRVNKNLINAIFTAIVLIAGAGIVVAQNQEPITPETQASQYMTYQGRMLNAGSPANGNYDFEFKITNTSGTVLQTIEALGVPVVNGIFTARFLVSIPTFATNGGENLSVGVRQLPTDPYTPLAPAQPISGTPVAFKAHFATQAAIATNASMLNGVTSDQFALTNDPRMSDARDPLPGSASYIQNGTTLQAAGFNITGVGNAEVFNAHSSYALDGFTVLAAPGAGNLFAGVNAGSANATGSDNALFGRDAGANNAAGSGNAFFGSGAGKYSTVDGNSFFGKHAGYFTTTGVGNSFYGFEAGRANTIGARNTFFGSSAGRSSTGFNNTFVGYNSGTATTTGSSNAFFGTASGVDNTTGTENSFFGYQAGNSNSTGLNNVFVGSGSGDANTTGSENVFIGAYAGARNISGSRNIYIGNGSGGFFDELGNDNVLIGYQADAGADVSNSVASGKGAKVQLSNQIVLGTTAQNTLVSGKLGIKNVPFGGSAPLCLDQINSIVSLCSASVDLKTTAGDSSAVNNPQAQIDSLKTLISEQQKQFQKQQEQIELLKRAMCEANATAAICKEKE